MNKSRLATIFNIKTNQEFEKTALEVFQFQAQNCAVYGEFINLLKINVEQINTIEKIPFLPIEFFKSHKVYKKGQNPQIVFSSSGTTGSAVSKHFVTDLSLYEMSFLHAFSIFYGNPKEYNILALLPSYLEREGSSLVYMVNKLIELSDNKESGFYLNEIGSLTDKLLLLDKHNKKTLLIGVSYALLDLIEKNQFFLKNTVIMETGGMKGKRKELVKEELHQVLRASFGVNTIHSEYGMTELLSQAYSSGKGLYTCPPWMKVLIRETNDPYSYLAYQKSGGINVIDLANINSCSFIATQDLGKLHKNGQFEVLGRFDNTDLRGCNLLLNVTV